MFKTKCQLLPSIFKVHNAQTQRVLFVHPSFSFWGVSDVPSSFLSLGGKETRKGEWVGRGPISFSVTAFISDMAPYILFALLFSVDLCKHPQHLWVLCKDCLLNQQIKSGNRKSCCCLHSLIPMAPWPSLYSRPKGSSILLNLRYWQEWFRLWIWWTSVRGPCSV